MSKPALDSGVIELITIYEISKFLSSSLDLRKTLREVLNVLEAHLDLRSGMVTLLQESGGLEIAAAIGVTREDMYRSALATCADFLGKIVNSGVSAVMPDVLREPLLVERAQTERREEGETVSFIGVPIKSDRRCLGVLSVEKTNRIPVNYERDIRFLSMVANLIGQTARLHQAVQSDRAQLLEEKHRLQRELQGKYSVDNVIARSKRMLEVLMEVHHIAPGTSTILLRGESGTGKEVIARAIHYLSQRREGPFIKVNCAALSESLLESELFGHEKGAFTGAVREHKGKFEQAHGGTLFLDEIGDVSPAFQAKLLRVLQERELERVGGSHTIRVDVRLIGATNRDLEAMVSAGQFRADLYYRINVVSIFLPPLRERPEDIPDLIGYFLERFNKQNERGLRVSPEAIGVFANCTWPGNVRELENCVERTALLARGSVIERLDVPCQRSQCLSMLLWRSRAESINIPGGAAQILEPRAAQRPPWKPEEGTSTASAAALHSDPQRERLIDAMERCGWVQAKAARMLNLTPRQMGYALKKFRIPLKCF